MRYLDADAKRTVVWEPWPIMDVHDTLSYLMGPGKIKISVAERQKFWRTSRANGEAVSQDVPSDEMYPIGLYGDSATAKTKFGQESILALFLNIPLFRPRSVRWSRFLICAIPEDRMTSRTLPMILRRIAWSCNHAYYGKFPDQGPAGEPLHGEAARRAGTALTADLDRFQVSEFRGDWSWQKRVFKFDKAHWNGAEVCHQCDAKGITDNRREIFWNIEDNTHRDSSLTAFLANRTSGKDICVLAIFDQSFSVST